MIDFTKPVQTRYGRKVRILCTDGPDKDQPVIGIMDGETGVGCWTATGKYYCSDRDCDLDLVQSPTEKEYYLHVFRSTIDGSLKSFVSEESVIVPRPAGYVRFGSAKVSVTEGVFADPVTIKTAKVKP